MEVEFLLSVGILILKHGAEGALSIIQNWKVKNPTAEDFQNLRDMVPKDEEFIP